MEIHVQGAVERCTTVPELRPMFILPPNYEVWMKRLSNRGFMGENEKQRRLRSAKAELQTAIDNPAFILVVNHEVELTVQSILKGRGFGALGFLCSWR